MLRKLRRAIRSWWECRTKKCTYYRHYLAYGPADLTHDGYHAAEQKCEYWQKELTNWYDAHPEGEAPKSLERICFDWERRVRA
jgi:hypothetical protein